MLFLGLSAPPISIPVPTLSPKGLSAEALSQGIVIAIFFYWGWDVLFNASESTEDSARNSRIAGYLVIGALILMFVFFTAVAQQSLTEEEMKKSDGNVLVALSNLTGAVYLLFAVKVAFFISTVGAIFASFIQFSQTILSQSRAGYFVQSLTKISSDAGAPFVAITSQASLAISVLALSAYSSTVDEILSATIGASAVFVAFYYGFATIACIVNEIRQKVPVYTKIARCLVPMFALTALWLAAALATLSFSLLATTVICVFFGVGIVMSFVVTSPQN